MPVQIPRAEMRICVDALMRKSVDAYMRICDILPTRKGWGGCHSYTLLTKNFFFSYYSRPIFFFNIPDHILNFSSIKYTLLIA